MIKENHRYYIINKPYGYLSQFVNKNTKRKKPLLGELADFPEGVMAIGRLDADSEGLLFLTTNGKASALVSGKKIEKEYYAQVGGVIDNKAISKLQEGVEISIKGKSYVTKECKARILDKDPDFYERPKAIRKDQDHGPTSWLSIVLKEGKNRQVRRMTAAVGHPTLRLIRVRIGNELLGDMPPKYVKEVKKFDI